MQAHLLTNQSCPVSSHNSRALWYSPGRNRSTRVHLDLGSLLPWELHRLHLDLGSLLPWELHRLHLDLDPLLPWELQLLLQRLRLRLSSLRLSSLRLSKLRLRMAWMGPILRQLWWTRSPSSPLQRALLPQAPQAPGRPAPVPAQT